MAQVSRPDSRALFIASRAALNLFRTIPEIVWAIFFVFAVGLGTFAGTLALGIHNAGVMGKLYAETLENTRRGAVEALRAGGDFFTALLSFWDWAQQDAPGKRTNLQYVRHYLGKAKAPLTGLADLVETLGGLAHVVGVTHGHHPGQVRHQFGVLGHLSHHLYLFLPKHLPALRI